MKFQSTPSVWRETVTHHLRRGSDSISIHSLRVEGDAKRTWRLKASSISIHSLRVEGDQIWHGNIFRYVYFNPLPPCGGRPVSLTPYRRTAYFNPLPPCGGRRAMQDLVMFRWCISIHSLRVEGDPDLRWCPIRRKHFNPLPPCGGRLYRPCFQVPM